MLSDEQRHSYVALGGVHSWVQMGLWVTIWRLVHQALWAVC